MNKPSFNSIVCTLGVGECASKVRQIDSKTRIKELPEFIAEIRQQQRNAITTAVSAAKAKAGGTYSIEVGDCIMPNGTMYVVGVVTRTA